MLRVDFDLREVSVVRGIEIQAGGDAELGVEPEIAVEIRVGLLREIPARGADDVRKQLEVAGGLQVEPAQLAGRRQAAERVGARERRPVCALAVPLDVPVEVHAPRLRCRPVSQRAERNAELGAPAALRHAGLDLPAAVPARRGVPLVSNLRVVLHACRVGPEHEAVLLVPVGVENNLERIHVAEAGVAAGIGRHDLRRIPVVHDRAHIDRLVVVGDADLGGLGGRLSLEWFGLHEAGERRRVLPDAIIQDAVYGRRLHRCDRRGDRTRRLPERGRGAGEKQKNKRSYMHF
jgi:hypothetical protein